MSIRQISVREMQAILKDNNYTLIRQCGSHRVWSNGKVSISVPSVKLKSVVANRIIKENHLRIGG